MAHEISELKSQHEEFDKTLAKQVTFQRRWQTISMSVYFFTTGGTLISSAGATLTAALEINVLAAVLSASAVVLIGIEKSLLFRERWKFHLLIYSQLLNIQNALATSQIDLKAASRQYGATLKTYAAALPIASRE